MEMAYGESNSHVSDNVTWPRKVTLVTSIGLEFSISKMAVDRGSGSKRPPTGNGLCRIEWSRDRWRRVTPRGQVVTPIRLLSNISKTAGDAI